MTFDCQACGACCDEGTRGFDEDRHVPLWMIGPLDGKWWEDDLLGTKIVDGQCIALDGKIGECVRCTIYDQRPALCRMFEAGSPDCLRPNISPGPRNTRSASAISKPSPVDVKYSSRCRPISDIGG